VLDGRLIERSQQVKKAMYWLPKFLNRANDKEVILFRNLEDKTLKLENDSIIVKFNSINLISYCINFE
jgi:hypothetical protein